MIYIIGPTCSGKSTLARAISKVTGAKVVEAGAWIRERTNCHEHGEEASTFLARESRKALAEDPLCSLKELRKMTSDPTQAYIVVGLRNPTDFAGLYDEHGGVVIQMTGEATTDFEREGLRLIREAVPACLILTRDRYAIEDVIARVTPIEKFETRTPQG